MKTIYSVSKSEEREEILLFEPENAITKKDFVNIMTDFGIRGKRHEISVDMEYLYIATYKNYMQISILTDNTSTRFGHERRMPILFIFEIEKEDKSLNHESLTNTIIEKIKNFAAKYNFTINEKSQKALEQDLTDIIKKTFFRKISIPNKDFKSLPVWLIILSGGALLILIIILILLSKGGFK